jgi:aspartate/methionine/tyrosine aminotransferase
MSVKRLEGIAGFSIDRVARAAGDDPEVLRMENLDTDLPPPPAAIDATREAVGRDADNSYLPFTGREDLRLAVAGHVGRMTGNRYTAEEVVITCGGTEGLLDVLLATTDPGDEVIVSDPTYAGMIYRVKLAGAVPRLVPFVAGPGGWRFDLQALQEAVSPRTRALFLMNPSMPSGAVLDAEEWDVVAEICRRSSLWLIYNAAMERIVFDGHPVLSPAGLPGMRERTIIVGSVSKEYRMIGWRIGWVAGPSAILEDVARVHIYNVVTPTGIAQAGALAALTTADDGVLAAVAEWQRRRDIVNQELAGFRVIPAAGGWSELLDVGVLGLDAQEASRRLLARGKVAATPMTHWGLANSAQFVRFVFSNEPVERLQGLGERVRRAFAGG